MATFPLKERRKANEILVVYSLLKCSWRLADLFADRYNSVRKSAFVGPQLYAFKFRIAVVAHVFFCAI